MQFFFYFLEDISPFCRATDTPLLDISGFQSHCGRSYFHLWRHTWYSFLRFTSGSVTTSWQPAWQPSHSHPHTCEEAWDYDLLRRCFRVWDKADVLPTAGMSRIPHGSRCTPLEGHQHSILSNFPKMHEIKKLLGCSGHLPPPDLSMDWAMTA